MDSDHISVYFIVLLPTHEEVLRHQDPSLQFAGSLINDQQKVIEDNKTDLFGSGLSDERKGVLIQELSVVFEDGEVGGGELLLELVHPGATNDLIDLVVDLGENLLEIGLDVDEGLIVAMRGAGLLDDFLKEHFVAGDPEGGLQELILRHFISCLGILPTELTHVLVGFYEFLQEALR